MKIYSSNPHTFTSTLYLGLKTIMFMVAPFYQHLLFHVKQKHGIEVVSQPILVQNAKFGP